MKKAQQQIYTCLTFFEPDIKELIQLFQNNLQDVEIIIDGLHISDITQLEQFDPPYQATSLVARGYSPAMVEDAKSQEERLLIELKMSNVSAVLHWNKVGQTDHKLLVQIRTLLLRQLSRVHQYMTVGASILCLFMPISLLESVTNQYQPSSIISFLLGIVGSVLLGSVGIFLYAFIIHFLKMKTTVFLLPGAIRVTRMYGQREAVSRLIIALVLLVVFEGSFLFALRLF